MRICNTIYRILERTLHVIYFTVCLCFPCFVEVQLTQTLYKPEVDSVMHCLHCISERLRREVRCYIRHLTWLFLHSEDIRDLFSYQLSSEQLGAADHGHDDAVSQAPGRTGLLTGTLCPLTHMSPSPHSAAPKIHHSTLHSSAH